MRKFDESNMTDLLTELCSRVGLDYETFKFVMYEKYEGIVCSDHDPEWFHQKEWTVDEHNAFGDWIVDYLVEKKICDRKQAKKESLWFLLSYSWKFSDSPVENEATK